jgi:NitT/TauT family transport system permease protein
MNRLRRTFRAVFDVIIYALPLVVFIAAWQWLTGNSPERQFIFSSPSQIWDSLISLAISLDLFRDSAVTMFEAVGGFILGTSAGAAIGLSLWYSRIVARISRPYIVAVGSVPVFALAPVMIVWFGVGMFSKVMMAALSTVVVAIVQAYQGAMSVEERHLQLMQVMGATRSQTFRKVVIPSALIWVVNSMKLNIGFALLGAFIGEFISAEKGLGYLILKSSGLYDMATVFAGILALMVLALILTFGVGLFERLVLSWRFKNE